MVNWLKKTWKSWGWEPTTGEELHSLLDSKGARNKESNGRLYSTTVTLSGLTCASCILALKKIICPRNGVDPSSVSVTLVPQMLCLVHDPDIIGVQEIQDIVRNCGYEALGYSKTPLSGESGKLANNHILSAVFVVHNKASEREITSAMDSISGVIGYLVEGDRIKVDYNCNIVKKRDILEEARNRLIELDPLDISIKHRANIAARKAARDEIAKFVLGALLAVPTSVLGMGKMFLTEGQMSKLDDEIVPGFSVMEAFMLSAATICQFYIGFGFYVGAFKALFYRHAANMDVLVVLGTSVAYVYSLVQTGLSISRGYEQSANFYDAAILVMTFMVLGRGLENLAKRKMIDSIEKLSDLSPPEATLVDPKTMEESKIIPSHLVEVGDTLKVSNGKNFPCDGVIVSGSTLVEESMITGESLLCPKSEGDKVVGGTVNCRSCVLIRAERVGSETTLSGIIRLVEQAQNTGAPIQTFANTVCYYFVPLVTILSFGTFMFWYYYLSSKGANFVKSGDTVLGMAFRFAISVLVVACPCAIGLAIPAATIVGTGTCALYGIIVKGGGMSFEVASKLGAVVFDKTGTLTYGEVTVQDYIIPKNSAFMSEQELWQLLKQVENESSHPLSAALKNFAAEKLAGASSRAKFEVIEALEIPGKGIKAKVRRSKSEDIFQFCVGNSACVKEVTNIDEKNKDFQEALKKWENEKISVIYISLLTSKGQQEDVGLFLGAIAFTDRVRPNARKVLQEMKNIGLDLYMISGDIHKVALSVGSEVGINSINTYGNTSPSGKREIIEYIKMKYSRNTPRKTVAMVGDGINDSVALASADLGIAIGAGSDIAAETASVILMKSDLRDILVFLKLAKIIYNRIKFNFFWAFAYNLVSIPLAMGVAYTKFGITLSPALSAAIMTSSSISVVISSILLYVYKPPRLNTTRFDDDKY